MPTQIHKFVSISFKEDFDLSKLSADWKTNTFIADPKDTRIKTVSSGGTIFIYNFGALTFVDVDPLERTAEVAELNNCLGFGLDAKVTSDEFTVEEAPEEKSRVEYTKMVLNDLLPERMAVIAQIMAQSAAMEYYERVISDVKNQVLDLIVNLKEKGKVSLSPKALYRKLGNAMLMRAEVSGVLHMLDKPEQIWEDKTMDGLFNDLRAAFDLGERFKALEHKLELIQSSTEILAETVKDSRTYRAEWLVIILIAIEIVLSLLSIFKILPH